MDSFEDEGKWPLMPAEELLIQYQKQFFCGRGVRRCRKFPREVVESPCGKRWEAVRRWCCQGAGGPGGPSGSLPTLRTVWDFPWPGTKHIPRVQFGALAVGEKALGSCRLQARPGAGVGATPAAAVPGRASGTAPAAPSGGGPAIS